eukprot:jgi/Hompol1/4732/HPOL_003857-RA
MTFRRLLLAVSSLVCAGAVLLLLPPPHVLLAEAVALPVYFHVLLLLNLGLWCWATNLHALGALGIDTYLLLEAPRSPALSASSSLAALPSSLHSDVDSHAMDALASRNPSRLPLDSRISGSPSDAASMSVGPTISIRGITDIAPHQYESVDKSSQSTDGGSHQTTVANLYRMALASSALTLVSLWAFAILSSYWGEEGAEIVPLLTYACILVFLANPWPVMFHSERFRFLRSLGRSAFDGLWSPVPFCDVVLSDILTSFSRVVGDMQLVFCDLMLSPDSEWHPSGPGTGIQGSNPMLSRQSARVSGHRLDSRAVLEFNLAKARHSKQRHLANALKYLSSLPVIYCAFTINRLRILSHSAISSGIVMDAIRMQFDYAVGLWVFFSVINSAFSLYWDIVNDWSLGYIPMGKRHTSLYTFEDSTPIFLRSVRYFRIKAVYYVAIVVDTVLRFSWIAKITLYYRLAEAHAAGNRGQEATWNDTMVLSTLVAVDLALKTLEILRRWMWVFFRIEREWVVTGRASVSGTGSSSMLAMLPHELQETSIQ